MFTAGALKIVSHLPHQSRDGVRDVDSNKDIPDLRDFSIDVP